MPEDGGEGNVQFRDSQSLFVTPKTVENHLGRMYAVPGIDPRKQLAKAPTSEAQVPGEAAN